MKRTPNRLPAVQRTPTSSARLGLVGVLGGCGGCGATSMVAALAACAPGDVVIVDVDALGGGIDIALGVEDRPGARWSGLHAGGGHLDPTQLLEGLPRWAGVPLLACDSSAVPDADAVRSVLGATREVGAAVLDLGRCSTMARNAALAVLDVLVLVVPAQIRGASAAAAMRTRLVEDGWTGPTGLVVRRDDPVVDPERIAGILATRLAGRFDEDPGVRGARHRGIDPRRFSRSTRHLADDLWTLVQESTPSRAPVAV